MFKLTQYRRLEMDSLFKGYANGFITDDELDLEGSFNDLILPQQPCEH